MFVYNYNASPLGLTISKYLLGVNFSRSFFFFIEPVYHAFFCLINVLVIGKHLPRYSKLFIKLNILAGILTASYLFFVCFLVVKIFQMKRLFKIFLIVFLALLLSFNLNIIENFFSSSSFDDRSLRIQIALEIISKADPNKIIFGSGFLFDHGFNRGISSGLFSSIVESGLIGFIIPLVLGLIFSCRNKTLIIIFIIGLLVLELYKLPLFWMAFILAGQIEKNENVLKLNYNLIM